MNETHSMERPNSVVEWYNSATVDWEVSSLSLTRDFSLARLSPRVMVQNMGEGGGGGGGEK